MFLYNRILQPLLFSMEPEKAHHLTMQLAGLGLSLPLISQLLKNYMRSPSAPVQKMGLTFPNPVGLAAGFDKDGKYLHILPHLGFGFIEVGTVTPRPQSGNPKPRLFRLKEDQALINRMGFNNEGLQMLQSRLDSIKSRDYILGGNIGKNKDTPNEQALDDYRQCFEGLCDRVDYFVINVSSPNTPGLRALQEKEPLRRLLGELQNLNQGKTTPRPLLLKVAPDLTTLQMDDIAEIITECQMHGLVTTNTTISRDGLQTSPATLEQIGAGGLSGAPLKQKSDAILKEFRDRLGADKTLIGVGGINSPEDAVQKMELGADLVQIYSGLVYKGPLLISKSVELISNAYVSDRAGSIIL